MIDSTSEQKDSPLPWFYFISSMKFSNKHNDPIGSDGEKTL